MKNKYSFENMKEYFDDSIEIAKTTKSSEAISVAAKLIKNKEEYLKIQKATKIPWYLIAAIHSKECSGRMDRYLGNGQRLDRVTTIVPKGRGPFKSFAEGAIDALGTQAHLVNSLELDDGWSMAECLWFAMRYNGTGYNARGMHSPYVFCGTNLYVKGGYPRDGHFDPNHVVKNIGVFPILWGFKELQEPIFDTEIHRVNLTAEEKPELFSDEV